MQRRSGRRGCPRRARRPRRGRSDVGSRAEPGEAGGGRDRARRSRSSTAAQYAALLTWPMRSTSVERSGHPTRVPSAGGAERELRRRDAPLRGFRVVVEARADASRTRVGPEVDPRAVDLDRPAGVAGERPAPPGRERREAAAPRHDVDEAVVEERRDARRSARSGAPRGARAHPNPSRRRRRSQRPGDSARRRPGGADPSRPRRRDARDSRPESPARGRLWHESLHAARPYASCSTILPSSSPGSSST